MYVQSVVLIHKVSYLNVGIRNISSHPSGKGWRGVMEPSSHGNRTTRSPLIVAGHCNGNAGAHVQVDSSWIRLVEYG